jgi:hypothetical protein
VGIDDEKAPPAGGYAQPSADQDSSAVRRGLLVAALAAVALAGLPAAASAGPDDPIVYMSVTDGWAYPQGYDVSFGFVCVSPTSAIVSCEGSQPMGSKLDTFHAGPHTVSVTATDYEGRQTTASATYTVIDITKPHVIFRTPTDGATFDQGSYVTADYGCEDDPGGLGLYEGYCAGTIPVGAPIDTSQIGTFSLTVTTVDLAFNVDQETIHYSVADRTSPTISLATPGNGATYTLGEQVWASYSCDDPNGSGIQSCKGDVGSGAPIDTSSFGIKTFTVTAYDRAGNVARTTHSYSVVYDFAGFASPAAPYPTATSVKAGEAIPLKFSLHGDQGTDIFAAGSPGWMPCGALDGPTAAAGSLSYNASADRYTFLAATAKAWAGSCRDLVATFRDGTTHRARFTFTK